MEMLKNRRKQINQQKMCRHTAKAGQAILAQNLELANVHI
jgi:hypothetical protein